MSCKPADGKTITQLPYAFGLCKFSCLNTFQPCLAYLETVLKVQPTSMSHSILPKDRGWPRNRRRPPVWQDRAGRPLLALVHGAADLEGTQLDYHLTFEQVTSLNEWLKENGY